MADSDAQRLINLRIGVELLAAEWRKRARDIQALPDANAATNMFTIGLESCAGQLEHELSADHTCSLCQHHKKQCHCTVDDFINALPDE